MKIAITGSSGLIGSAVVRSLHENGHDVIRLVRQAPANSGQLAWDPLAVDGGLSPRALAGTDAVVHLAGAGIADRRWTNAYRAQIRDSRVLGTRALVTALRSMDHPPSVLLSGSAIGWYGNLGGAEVDESAPCGQGFLAGVVRDWEASARPAALSGIRLITMRTGIVLSPRGGVLGRMLTPFRFGLGAKLGRGSQIMSWITLADLTSIVGFLLSHPEISGPVNLTTPNPVTNAEFTSALAAALHRPALLALPTPMLRLALGGVSSDILSSARVMPRVLMAAGYQFELPSLREALTAILSAAAPPRPAQENAA
jgi:uncharacterized protein (TIGR01777 family)